MKKEQLQKMIKSIFSDDSVRARFAKDPEGVLAGYALIATEKAAVMSPKMRLALVTENNGIVADSVLENWF